MRKRILDFGILRFPDATESSQLLKTYGEIYEYYNETPFTDLWYFELADVYIAAVHCFERFGNVFCKFLVEQIEERSDFYTVKGFVERKMDINEQRTWKGDKHIKKTIKRLNYKTGEITEEIIDA